MGFLFLAGGDLFAGQNSSCMGILCGSDDSKDVRMPFNRLKGLELNPLVGFFNQLRDKSKAYLESNETSYQIQMTLNPTSAFKETYQRNLGYLRWMDATFERMRDTIDMLRMGRDPGINMTLVDESGMEFMTRGKNYPNLPKGFFAPKEGSLVIRMPSQGDFKRFLANPTDPQYQEQLSAIVHELTHESFYATYNNLWETLPEDEFNFYQDYFSNKNSNVLNEALARQQQNMLETLTAPPSTDYYNPMGQEDIRDQIGWVAANLYSDKYRTIFDRIDPNPKLVPPEISYLHGWFGGSHAEAWGYRAREMLPFFIPPANVFSH